MSKQVRINGKPTDTLGLSPVFQKKVVVQLQPQCEQIWASGVRQLEMGSVQTKVLRGDPCDCMLQVPGICQSPAF